MPSSPLLASPLRTLSSAPPPPVPPEVARAQPPKPKGKSRTPPKPRKKKELPELVEEELEESFVRGSGPGGQATNKTSNACSLIHKPTGMRVHCHESRSREENRRKARRIMREKLDHLLSPPGESSRDLAAARERQKKEAKRRKGARKRAAKNEEAEVEAAEEGAGGGGGGGGRGENGEGGDGAEEREVER
ncbi:hypothetical protein JCM8547_008376 [Rhodosporidiobolus lusitaniae]